MDNNIASVVVDLPGRAYPINIGSELLDRAGDYLRERSSAQRVTVVTDSNVGPLYAEKLSASLECAGFEDHVLTVPAGDTSKSAAQAAILYDGLSARHHSRTEPIIALGGGVVGDLAGFVAATWLRGVPFMQCPTTVEADVDASVGGKTAINHPAGKNMIGAFHQPLLVCIDTSCFKTLSRRDFVAGLAESVKHAVIRDVDFLAWHEDHSAEILAQDPGTVRELIRRNCENKAQVVVADEREEVEQGVGRAALNFGHTIGHAIESQFNYELRHGEAVALGIVAAMDLAVRMCGFADAQRNRVEALLKSLELPIRSPRPLDVPDILARLSTDKKVRDRTVRFILPTSLGSVGWFDAPSEEHIAQAVRRLQAP